MGRKIKDPSATYDFKRICFVANGIWNWQENRPNIYNYKGRALAEHLKCKITFDNSKLAYTLEFVFFSIKKYRERKFLKLPK